MRYILRRRNTKVLQNKKNISMYCVDKFDCLNIKNQTATITSFSLYRSRILFKGRAIMNINFAFLDSHLITLHDNPHLCEDDNKEK